MLSDWQNANYDSAGLPVEIQAGLATQNPELVSESNKIDRDHAYDRAILNALSARLRQLTR